MTSLGIGTIVTILAAGLIFLLALVLGIWKYRQMATSENHLAHPYVDIAHRAAWSIRSPPCWWRSSSN